LRHRQGAFGSLIRAGCLAALAAPLVGAALPAPDSASIVVEIGGLRSKNGQIMACMTADPKSFPDCQKDPQALHLTVPAINGGSVNFKVTHPGRYAIALFHDENANGRMDKMLMMPREGFGFSRDAPLQFGPPRFGAASFPVGTAEVHTAIHVRYLL
jgi:uncharacterized protein (DUF2141 family)